MKAELGLDFPLLSDESLQLIEAVDLKDPDEPKSVRGFAILDKEGNVIEAHQVNPFGDEVANIISFAAEKVAQ